MQCDYLDAGVCRSCTLLGVPYARQLADKQATVAATLEGVVPAAAWRTPFANRESGFRNKAKLVVGGTTAAPTLGILDRDGHGTDLRGCGLYEPGLHEAVLALGRVLPRLGLQPYDVPARQGELKHLLVTHSPTGELMVRAVLRSTNQVRRLERGLPLLREALPGLRVLSANLQPAHAAILEGEEEIVLTEHDTLPLPVADVVLHLGTRSFAQTSTGVADALYRQVGEWAVQERPRVLWDLYCGVGGFALHAASRLRAVGAPARVLGIESSPEAIRSARRSADEHGLAGTARFLDGDARTLARQDDSRPDLVVVNPPRRGIGPELARWLDRSPATAIAYSSCNPTTLARDLAAMPSWVAVEARVYDMFPQTAHAEVLVRLTRR